MCSYAPIEYIMKNHSEAPCGEYLLRPERHQWHPAGDRLKRRHASAKGKRVEEHIPRAHHGHVGVIWPRVDEHHPGVVPGQPPPEAPLQPTLPERPPWASKQQHDPRRVRLKDPLWRGAGFG
jgi:hypothetical protein